MEEILNLERPRLLKELAMLWQNDFNKNKEFYTEKLIPMVILGDFSKITIQEKKIITEIQKNLKKEEWQNLENLLLKEFSILESETNSKEILKKAENYIKNDKFIEYEALFKKNQTALKRFEGLYEEHLRKYIKNLKNNVAKLSTKNFQNAVSHFYKEIKNLPERKRVALGLFVEEVENLINILKKHDFKDADEFFLEKKLMDFEFYEDLKKNYVLEYFKDKNIDAQKALAIASVRENILLKARAGSGKTSTICLKTLLLTEKYNIKPEEILILAFNRDAKTKIREDLYKKYGFQKDNFQNAKTFHSFAKSIYSDKKIIEKTKRKELIKRAIENILEKENYKKDFYKFYKTSLNIPIKKEINIEDSSKITFLKDLSQITLKGEIVKSFGEKYIADFLFEHGIDYEYEKSITFSKNEKETLNIDDGWNVYRPDFYITQGGKEFYLEHWGVDENALKSDYFGGKGVISDVSKYIKNMHIKRRYFKKKGIPLIETWAKDSQIRENFEITLSKTLKKFGIKFKKQNEEELFYKIKELNFKSFYKTIESFISTVKKSKFDNNFIEKKLEDKNISKRTKIFLKTGYEIYLEYQRLLEKENWIDFDDLIKNACAKIFQSKGECEFEYENEKIKISSLKYILIDEYQDFSKLFFDLILAIKCFNNEVKIFATGDDFQAINGFAGSNLYYFSNFKTLFNNSEIYTLTNNYRSYKKIIDTSNTFMSQNGFCSAPSKPVKKGEGEVLKINTDKTFINKDNPSDLAYFFKKDSGKIKAKYLKTVHRLIRLNPDKNFLILSRLNKISGSNLDVFSYKLLRMRTVDKNKIKVMTIHKSKGLEADIVIILRTINGVIPFIHPDYEIMSALNKSFREILDEERRLFYVALTRAKEKAFILTENKLESVYLKELNLKEINFRHLNFEDD